MPYIKVATNLRRASFDADSVLKAFSKSLSDTFDRPEAAVMVQLEFGQDLILSGSTESCACAIMFCSHALSSTCKINTQRNPKTYAALSATMFEQFKIPANRVFLNLDDINENNWDFDGKPVGV
ncbi:hypothetical protein Poli38472_008012 [Pythium oligandrum]|uniref:L-dopachrome isomerase n=1 Tax=Pythium oligandrum TaxID=41045 RepID=A0A8K1FIU1_PYTOL|nr:hypothetical protein Poli38472_008012 [Pythium oligandrum]|eukprot:TMW65370.1 hypothetical protein Poli38472_008012 [Pythium oligandrum]